MESFNKDNEEEEEVMSDTSHHVTLGSYLGLRLSQAGASHFFTVPGDYILNLLDELTSDSKLQLVGCCNELTAGYAADGYCRASGGLGVVVVTYMVGGLSVLNAVAGAYSDDLPLLVVSGGPNTNDTKQGHVVHHTTGERNVYPSAKCFEPVVAKTFVIHNTHDAAEMIDSAISTCLAESKPVYLEIPCNLTLQAIPAPCPMDDLRYQWNASDNRSMFTAIDHVLREIDHAQRPILIAGSKMRRAKALDEFMHLANALGCGVAVQPDAKGVINEEHTEYLGTYWGDISSCRELQQVVEGSDLVIFVGPQFSDYTTLGWSSPVEKSNSIVFSPSCVTVREARYHHVQMNTVLSSLAVRVPLKDGAKTEFNRLVEEAGGESACVPAKFQPMNLQTVSDECAQGNTLSELEMSGIAAPFNTPAKARQDTDGEGEHMAEGDHPSGRPAGIVSGLRAPFNTPNRSSESLPQTPNKGNGHRSRDPGTRTPLTVEGLTALLQEEVTRNTNTALLVETGDAWFIGQKLRLSANAWYYLQMQYGSTGWALGALLGIKMVRRNCRKVVALIGDGSFQASCQALSTLVRHAIKATVLVLNNRGYSTETQSGGGVGADVAAYSTLQNWDYAGLCEVFKDHEPITAASKSSGDLTAEEKEEQREEQADRSKRSRALGLRATTSEELQKALHRSDEFDGVVLIQCELAATDCSPEMTTFRQIVAQSSMRI